MCLNGWAGLFEPLTELGKSPCQSITVAEVGALYWRWKDWTAGLPVQKRRGWTLCHVPIQEADIVPSFSFIFLPCLRFPAKGNVFPPSLLLFRFLLDDELMSNPAFPVFGGFLLLWRPMQYQQADKIPVQAFKRDCIADWVQAPLFLLCWMPTQQWGKTSSDIGGVVWVSGPWLAYLSGWKPCVGDEGGFESLLSRESRPDLVITVG